MKFPDVTIDDLLNYTKAGGHEGIGLTDIEHTYAEFLYDIDLELSNNGVGDYSVMKRNKLNVNSNDIGYVKGYVKSQIDNIIRDYVNKYNINGYSLRSGKIDVNLEGCSPLSIFVIQHLLRINGYEIATKEGVSTKDLNFKMGRPNQCSLPIRKLTSPLNEERVKKSLDEKGIKGASYLRNDLAKLEEQSKKIRK